MTRNNDADIVLTGGRVHTVDPRRPQAQAIAVRDGRIVAVGSERDVKSLVGPSTRVVDLADRMVLPGFQDAHVHPVHGGLNRLRCDLRGARGREGCLELIAAYARAHPDRPWIVGGGWYMDDFPRGTPLGDDLDAIVPDRPVYLENRDGHGAWVNSRALEIAGIDASTPDPADGRIERDADGQPSGTLHEGAAEMVRTHVPDPTPDELVEGLRIGQQYLHSLGITAWQDAIVEDAEFGAYTSLAERGELTARVVGALWWDRSRGEDQIEALIDRRARGPIGRFSPTSVKIMQDGVLENFTGALTAPYLDGNGESSGNSGLSFVDPERLPAFVTRLDAEGFQVHFHAIGDRAVREALDAFEAAAKSNGRTDGRHHIAHIQVIHPDDVPRFGALGVVANAQPYWACHEGQMDRLTIPFLGPERTTWQYPFASLLRSGARLAMGSDWSVSTPNPLREIEVAVTRFADTTRDLAPFLPSERLDLADALAAFTKGSAYVNHLDAETGSIEVGKAADLAVLDRDLFGTDAGPIGEARCLLTLVEGVAVFEDPALDG
jgi:predicted amidohydrolase YtcJ